MEAGSWYGIFAPSGTPGALVAMIHSEIVRMLASPDVQQRLLTEGADAIGNTPRQFAAQLKNDMVKWAKVARESGIEPQ
jgi:tripartite-type tricarboxylate transporter receptor subunit TctC